MYRLVILAGGPKRAVVSLADASIGVGRDEDNLIQVDDASVWHHHAVLLRNCDGYILRNLGVRNSTFINGLPSQEARLKPGDRIRFGTVEFLYEAITEAETPDPNMVAGLTRQNALLLNELATVRKQLSDQQRESAERGAAAQKKLAEAEAGRRQLMTELATARHAMTGGPIVFHRKKPSTNSHCWKQLSTEVDRRARQVIACCRGLLTRSWFLTGEERSRVAELARSTALLMAAQRRLGAAEPPATPTVSATVKPKTALARACATRDSLAAELDQMQQAATAAGLELKSFRQQLAAAQAQAADRDELESKAASLNAENAALADKLLLLQEDLARAKQMIAEHNSEEFNQLRRDLTARQATKPGHKSSRRWHRYILPFGRPAAQTATVALTPR